MANDSVVLDFTNVKDGGGTFNKRRLPAGDYLAKVTKVELTKPKDKSDKTPMWLFSIAVERNGKVIRTFPYYCKLQENQLWKVRNLFAAAGITIPKKRVKLDPSKIVGKLIGVTLEDDEYEGKEQSTVDAVIPASEVTGTVAAEDDEDEETEDEADEESDDDDDDEGDSFDAMDRSDLKAYIKTKGYEITVKKSMDDDDIRVAIRAAEESDDSDDEEEEDEEPEEAPKAPKKKGKKKVTDDELEELDIDEI